MKTKASSKRNRSRSSTKKRAAETMPKPDKETIPKPDKETRGGGDKERAPKADGEAGDEPDKEAMPKPDPETNAEGSEAFDSSSMADCEKDDRKEPGGFVERGARANQTTRSVGRSPTARGAMESNRSGGAKPGEKRRRRKRKRKVVGPSKQDNQVELDPVDLAFAEAEVKERAARGWSIDEVAERATVKRGTIQHVEHHRRGISLRLANRIAKAYDHTLGTFLDLSGKVFSTLLEGVLALGMA
ncbi:MAG: helix-turn-helix domain-containing protein [Verrucomicrobiaceae bacterium]|nr:helix-turn-helix domain-containing protein [Verrucomicrobiaceae bacterium]